MWSTISAGQLVMIADEMAKYDDRSKATESFSFTRRIRSCW